MRVQLAERWETESGAFNTQFRGSLTLQLAFKTHPCFSASPHVSNLSLSLSQVRPSPALKMTTLSNSVKLKYIKLGYQCPVNHILAFFLIPILMGFLIKILSLGPDQIYEIWSSLHFDLLQFLGSSLMIIFFATVQFMSKPRSVYLVDHACFKPPAAYRVPHATLLEHLRLSNKDNPEIVEFQRRILQRSGLGDETCWLLQIYIFLLHPAWSLQGMKRSLFSSLLLMIC